MALSTQKYWNAKRISTKYLLLMAFLYVGNAKSLHISGKISHLPELTPILYLDMLESVTQVYSLSPKMTICQAEFDKQGEFVIEFQIPENQEVLLRLRIGFGIFTGGYQENYIYFTAANNEKVNLKANYKNFTGTYRIKGNETSKQIREIRELRSEVYDVCEMAVGEKRMSKQYQGDFDKAGSREQFLLNYIHANNEQLEKYVKECQNPVVVIMGMAIHDYNANFSGNFLLYDSISLKLMEKFPENTYVLKYREEIIRYKTYLPRNSKMIDIELNDSAANLIKINTDSKLTLIEFWASWCAPCRMEIKESIIPLYNKFSPMGFNIYALSIDKQEDKWKNALRQDKTQWVNLHYPKGIKNYDDFFSISYVPFNILVNTHGEIIAKDLHGKDLEDFVTKYLTE